MSARSFGESQSGFNLSSREGISKSLSQMKFFRQQGVSGYNTLKKKHRPGSFFDSHQMLNVRSTSQLKQVDDEEEHSQAADATHKDENINEDSEQGEVESNAYAEENTSPFTRMGSTHAMGMSKAALLELSKTPGRSPSVGRRAMNTSVKSLASLRGAMPLPYVAPKKTPLMIAQEKNPKATTRGRFATDGSKVRVNGQQWQTDMRWAGKANPLYTKLMAERSDRDKYHAQRKRLSKIIAAVNYEKQHGL